MKFKHPFVHLLPVFFLCCGLTGCNPDRTIIYATFDRVDGLTRYDQVQSRGLAIGQVTHLTLFGKDQVLVQMALLPEAAIPADSKFALQSQDLLGTKAVEVTYGEASDLLTNGDTVAGQAEINYVKSISLDSLSGPAAKTVELVKHLLEQAADTAHAPE
ncbi:MAG: MCE family protein [Bacteroidota bacterium]